MKVQQKVPSNCRCYLEQKDSYGNLVDELLSSPYFRHIVVETLGVYIHIYIFILIYIYTYIY